MVSGMTSSGMPPICGGINTPTAVHHSRLGHHGLRHHASIWGIMPPIWGIMLHLRHHAPIWGIMPRLRHHACHLL